MADDDLAFQGVAGIAGGAGWIPDTPAPGPRRMVDTLSARSGRADRDLERESRRAAEEAATREADRVDRNLLEGGRVRSVGEILTQIRDRENARDAHQATFHPERATETRHLDYQRSADGADGGQLAARQDGPAFMGGQRRTVQEILGAVLQRETERDEYEARMNPAAAVETTDLQHAQRSEQEVVERRARVAELAESATRAAEQRREAEAVALRSSSWPSWGRPDDDE